MHKKYLPAAVAAMTVAPSSGSRPGAYECDRMFAGADVHALSAQRNWDIGAGEFRRLFK